MVILDTHPHVELWPCGTGRFVKNSSPLVLSLVFPNLNFEGFDSWGAVGGGWWSWVVVVGGGGGGGWW